MQSCRVTFGCTPPAPKVFWYQMKARVSSHFGFVATLRKCPFYVIYYINPLHPRWDIRLQHYFAIFPCLLLNIACASPHVIPISSSSVVTVRRHVAFDRPGFLLPGGVHLRATLGMRSGVLLKMWPSHLILRICISRIMLLQP